jgi:hypothetical protein
MAHRHSLTARLAGQPPAIGNRHGLYRLFELRIRSASVCARVAAGPIVAGFRIVPWHRGRPNCAGRRLNAGRTRLTALVGCARPLAPQSTPTSSMASPRRWAGTRWDAGTPSGPCGQPWRSSYRCGPRGGPVRRHRHRSSRRREYCWLFMSIYAIIDGLEDQRMGLLCQGRACVEMRISWFNARRQRRLR